MHHFRGKLFEGDRIHLDPANVYVQFHHATADGSFLAWHGYLLLAAEATLEPGASYTLTLTDGRSGNLRIDSFVPDTEGKFRAIFVGEGPLG